MYEEIDVDPVAAGWDQAMIGNSDAKYRFVFMSRNALGKPTASTRHIIASIISVAVSNYCAPYNVDSWYYAPEEGKFEHKLYVSDDSWIVYMRMMNTLDPGFFRYMLARIDRVEKRIV